MGHTGAFHCCPCCEGRAGVHCCGACCAGDDFGARVPAEERIACQHICAKGLWRRHDLRPAKKPRRTGVVQDEWEGMPVGGVGRWSCCGSGGKVQECGVVRSPRGGGPVPFHDPAYHSTTAISLSPEAPAAPTPGSLSPHRDFLVSTPKDDLSDHLLPPSHPTVPPTALHTAQPPSLFSPALCDECQQEEAVLWCNSCSALFCTLHFRLAHATKVGKRHSYTPLSVRPTLCHSHPDQPCLLYCYSCATPVCRNCCCGPLRGPHAEHTVTTLAEAEKDAATQLEPALDELRGRLEEVEATRREVVRVRTASERSATNAKQAVRVGIDELISAVVTELEKKKEVLLLGIDQTLTSFVTRLSTVEAVLLRASSASKSAHDLIHHAVATHHALPLLPSLSQKLAATRGVAFPEIPAPLDIPPPTITPSLAALMASLDSLTISEAPTRESHPTPPYTGTARRTAMLPEESGEALGCVEEDEEGIRAMVERAEACQREQLWEASASAARLLGRMAAIQQTLDEQLYPKAYPVNITPRHFDPIPPLADKVPTCSKPVTEDTLLKPPPVVDTPAKSHA
eukprot:Sspe_Gene.76855::Locus_48005_Transcript_1_1_Confidence_1.000_Length_1756::g.76855::m.76855